MEKVAMIPSLDLTERIFSASHKASISSFGRLVFNDERGGPSPERVRELIKDADVVITSWGCPKLTEDILDADSRLKLVIHAAGSVKGIVTPALWERGIRVVTSAEALAKGVAESTLGFMITTLKHMWWLNEDIHNGEWNKNISKVREIYDLTVGVIGASRVGRHFIRLLSAFDVNVLLYDPTVTEAEAQQLGVTKVGLEDLLKESDVVSIHAPEIPETYKMINREGLRIMKDNAVLINTARGSIVDEEALVEELKRKRIYACIDVTDPEPPVSDHPLRSLSNVIMTPHIAGLTNNGLRRIGQYVTEELGRFVNTGKLNGEVTRDMLDIIA